MKFDKTTVRELKRMAIGQGAAVALICLGALMIQKLDLTVLLGALYGAAVALGYFFSICWSVTKTLQKVPEEQQAESAGKAARGALQGSYTFRLLLTAGLLFLAFKSPYTANIPAVIPFFLIRPIATFKNPFSKEDDAT